MRAASLLLFALPSLLSAKEPLGGVKATGYLKELWQYSRSPLDNRPYFLSTSRARVSLEAKAGVLRGQADYDHEVLAGSYFRTAQHRLFGLGEAPAWLDMDQNISTSATSIWRHRLYRGWLGVETDAAVARFGRQRIAWGTNKLWNPTDVLNPYQPVSVEREERRGVDALYARAGLGALSQAELAWAPQDRWPEQALLSRLKTNWRDYDLSLMGGKVSGSTGSWMAGGDFAGNLLEGTLHGEWSYTDPRTRTGFWKAGLGYDYNFPADSKLPGFKDLAVVAEYFHNGAGAPDTSRYDFSSLFKGREVTLARHYAGLTLSKDVHPLVKLEAALIANLEDSSHYLSPSLQWNALPDLYLTATLQRFSGKREAEFGRPPNLVYLQAQWYF